MPLKRLGLIPVINVMIEGKEEIRLFTGEDDDPDGVLRAELLAKLGVPEDRIWFGDSSHQEQYRFIIEKKGG